MSTSKLATLVTLAAVLLAPSVAAAKRTISGFVYDRAGRPVVGVTVKAWDQDSIHPLYGIDHAPNDTNGAQNDLMGTTKTNASGFYRITFAPGHWDPCFGHSIDPSWRPDIYVTVEPTFVKPSRRNSSSVEARSVTIDNWRHDWDLWMPKLITDIDSWAKRRTGFNPSYHGFNFKNTTFLCGDARCRSEHATAELMVLEGLASAYQFNWALCGGMSNTALKRYLSRDCGNYKLANLTSANKIPTALKAEIVSNQIETLITNNAWAKFLEWQWLPDRVIPPSAVHSIGHNTKGQWPGIKAELDRGLPVIIGLVRVKADHPLDFNLTSKNHQVLATGYDYNPFYNEVVIYAYDPNYPGRTSQIWFNLKGRHSYINAAEWVPNLDTAGQLDGSYTWKSVRGLFLNRASGHSYWPHGSQVCRAAVNMYDVAGKTRPTTLAEASLNKRRVWATVKLASDRIAPVRVSCELSDAQGPVKSVTASKLAFFDAGSRALTSEVFELSFGYQSPGTYTVSCEAKHPLTFDAYTYDNRMHHTFDVLPPVVSTMQKRIELNFKMQ